MRAQNRYGYSRSPGNSEARKIVQQRIEANRQKKQQSEKYGGRYDSYLNQNQKGALPSSTRSEQYDKNNGKRYFQREKQHEQGKSNLAKDDKTKNSHSVGKTQETLGKFQKTNAEYMKLHDKLNHLEDKIAEMKKNLQRKKQEKLKKRQKEEELKKKKAADKKIKSKQVLKQEVQEKQENKLKGLVTQVPEHKDLHTFQRDPYSPRHNIYYVSEIVRAYKDDRSLARQHIQTSLQIMAYFQTCQVPSDEQITQMGKKQILPRRKGYQNKKTVVFDLDETLIHCNDSLNVQYDVKLPIVFPTGQVIQAGINIRPHAKEILKNLSKDFEVIVFTASHSCYANVVVDYLDPNKQYVHHRLFRQNCVQTPEGMHVKDLRAIDRDLSQMVLIDNAAYSYIYQIDNGIPIIPYYHGSHDYELEALEKYIKGMLLQNDVRTVNRKTFKLHQYNKYYNDLEQLVEDLYVVEHRN